MSTQVAINNSDLFNQYLDTCRDEVSSRRIEGYYPTNVVAEAYTKGFSDGKQSVENDFLNKLISNEIEKFTQKSNQIYILSRTAISFINEIGFSSTGLYINLTFNRPSVIISIPNKDLNNDDFVEKAYVKLYENKKIYSKLFNETLDIGFVASENLNEDLLKEDGFGYNEKYN